MSRNNLVALALVVLAVATLLHGSVAQTRHVVGDSTGWTVAGTSFYSTWAANKTFRLGDTLVFNFTTGQHDVARVTKSAYDGCIGTNALFTIMTGPATVPLNETGEQYYICTFTGHCAAGQKLSINVGKASNSPAPQPSASGSPPPKTSPVPAPQSPTTPPPSPVPASAPAPSTGGGSTTSPSPSAGTPPPSSGTTPSPSGPTTPSPSSPTNPSSPSPAGSVTPPPENSGAESLGALAFSATTTLLSVAAAFFY